MIYPETSAEMSDQIKAIVKTPDHDAAATPVDEHRHDGMVTTDKANAHTQRKSYQFRALSRKTLSYQKRQWCTNIGCVCSCPFLLVLMAFGIGFAIQGLIDANNPIVEILSCSNADAMNPFNNFPLLGAAGFYKNLPSVKGDLIVGATQPEVFQGNFLEPPLPTEFTRPGVSATLGNFKSCVYVFGPDYAFSEPYQRDPQVSVANRLFDTTFVPAPRQGWFNTTNPDVPFNMTTNYLRFNTLPWFYFINSAGVLDNYVGSRDRETPLTSPIQFSANYFPTSSNSLLSNIGVRYGLNLSLTPFISSPFFVKLDPIEGESRAFTLDNKISATVQSLYGELARVNKSAAEVSDPSDALKLSFYIAVSGIVAKSPHGGILFEAVDFVTKKFDYILEIGDDRRLSRAADFPSKGFRRLIAQSQLSNAFMRNINPALSNAQITQSIRAMPVLKSTKFSLPIGSLLGGILYPFGVSFLLPIFVITLVKEKETRIFVMMKMNGLKAKTYYFTHFIHFFSLHILSTLVFLVAGALVGRSKVPLEFFSKTSTGVLILVFFIWGIAQIMLAFVLSCFFSRSRTALVISFLLVLASLILNLATETLSRQSGEGPSSAYFLWPPFAFYRILSVINIASFVTSATPYTIAKIKPGDEVFTALMFLWVEIIFMALLALYFNAIIPTEFGVAKPWYFPFTDAKNWWKARKEKKMGISGSEEQLSDQVNVVVTEEVKKLEDMDVAAERERVLSDSYSEDSPLAMKRMRKVYKGRSGLGPKIAVKDVTFAVEEGIVFGLLGPNGAGKTTLISILTGLYPSSGGDARLAGFNIKTDMEQVYKNIGVCPQHDILWDDLTIEEHLLFYARIKGIPSGLEADAVAKAMEDVSLTKFKGRLSKGLSGGEKRRLSIAIALVGQPNVVFLDEPTTGLDPEVRRLIWTIINNARVGKTIVLTTHSMEEADVLCQRIGIMAKGALRCLGPQLRLKQLYGSGFKIFFTCQGENVQTASRYIESVLPSGWTKVDAFSTSVSYEFKPVGGELATLFSKVEANKGAHGIDDWGLSQTTLEEVFLRIISDNDAEAD